MRLHRLVGLRNEEFHQAFRHKKVDTTTRCWVVWVVCEGHGCESTGGIDLMVSGYEDRKVAQPTESPSEFPSEFPPAEAQ